MSLFAENKLSNAFAVNLHTKRIVLIVRLPILSLLWRKVICWKSSPDVPSLEICLCGLLFCFEVVFRIILVWIELCCELFAKKHLY